MLIIILQLQITIFGSRYKIGHRKYLAVAVLIKIMNGVILISSVCECAWERELSCVPSCIVHQGKCRPFTKYLYFLPGLHLPGTRAIKCDRWKLACNKAITLCASRCISLTKSRLMSHHPSCAFLSFQCIDSGACFLYVLYSSLADVIMLL